MEAVTPRKAATIARKAAARLAEMVQPDGRFLYRYMLPDPSVTDAAYSNVRHVAAVSALVQMERDGLPELGAAIDRAADFMVRHIFRRYGARALCVLDEGFIKLGGCALGVAASLALYRRSHDPAHLDRAAELADYIMLQQGHDGEFVQVRIPGPIARAHPIRGEMFAGQPILALALISEATGDPVHLDVAARAAEQLARRDFGVGFVSHWTLYALEALVRSRREPWMLAYARRLVDGMLADPAIAASPSSTPVACMTEGLLAFVRLSQSAGAEAAEISEALRHVRRALQHQLRFFHPSGAFVASLDRPEVRIDYIVHNLLGFDGYARLAGG